MRSAQLRLAGRLFLLPVGFRLGGFPFRRTASNQALSFFRDFLLPVGIFSVSALPVATLLLSAEKFFQGPSSWLRIHASVILFVIDTVVISRLRSSRVLN